MSYLVSVNPLHEHRSQLKRIPHSVKSKLLRLITSTLLVLGISSCTLFRMVGLTSDPADMEIPPVAEIPYTVKLTIIVDNDINPDLDGRPSPIKLKIFLTEPTIDFKAIEYSTYFGLDSSELGPSPIKTLSLRPGTTQIVELEGMKSQTQLAIAAAFRRPNQTKWLNSFFITADDQVDITAGITNIAVFFNSE